MKKKLIPMISFVLLFFIGCAEESPIEKVNKVFERVKSETFLT